MKGHKSRECPKYSPAEKPEQKSTQRLDTNEGERHVKHQRSFDTQQHKKLVYLSRYLARREMSDKMELGLQAVATRALMATLDEAQPHRISVRRRVVLESPRAHMFSQYLCGTETPDSAHIVHEVQIRDRYGEMQGVQVLIDSGATSTFMSPKLLRRLGLRHQAAHTTTLGLNGHVIEHANDSRKTTISVQYLNHLAPVDESEVLVVPIKAYDLVLGLPWLRARNPEIDWSKKLLLSLRNPTGSDTQDTLQNKQEESGVSIELHSATAFDDLLAGEEVTAAFALKIEDCIELLRATVERTDEKGEYPRRLNGRARSSGDSCGRSASTWDP